MQERSWSGWKPESSSRIPDKRTDSPSPVPAAAMAPALQRWRAEPGGPAPSPEAVLRLQREVGNRNVRRALGRAPEEGGDISPDVENGIQQARGGGASLDSSVRDQMEPAFGSDFSGVRVHTGAEADRLNHSVSARAFTTGQDIFFRQGEYNPGSSSGRELLAHELTHVVQQGGAGAAVQGKLTLGPADDAFEREADQVSRAVVQREKAGSCCAGKPEGERCDECSAQS